LNARFERRATSRDARGDDETTLSLHIHRDISETDRRRRTTPWTSAP
jgi:hypothetical protein